MRTACRELVTAKLTRTPFKFRPPDIGYPENVRFRRRSGRRGTIRRGAALDRRAGEGKADPPRRTHCEADPQARTGEDCCRLVEDHTERLGGVRAMWGAERSQGDIKLAIGHADVAGGGEQLMQQGSPLLIDTRVVRPQ